MCKFLTHIESIGFPTSTVDSFYYFIGYPGKGIHRIARLETAHVT